MSAHSTFPPSAAHRWLLCAGSVALEATLPRTSSKYADDGTVSHILAERALSWDKDAARWVGETIQLGEKTYTIDEDRAARVQMYLDDVRARAKGGYLLPEHQVELSDVLAEPDQFGTSDAIIVQPDQHLLIVEDLKDGIGKVFANKNPQLMLYALGALPVAELYAGIGTIRLVICQPRLDHIDEWDCSIAELLAFGERARLAVAAAQEGFATFNPGPEQCLWCRGKGKCEALAAKVQAEVGREFSAVLVDPPRPAEHPGFLADQYAALDLIEGWCSAVRERVMGSVMAGVPVIGTDGQPMKIVEGKRGNRAWADEKQAEGALCAQLTADKVYTRKVVSPAAAEKLLKKQSQLWKDLFVPLITQSRGRPSIALGSDERPAYTNAAAADEFSPTEELLE